MARTLFDAKAEYDSLEPPPGDPSGCACRRCARDTAPPPAGLPRRRPSPVERVPGWAVPLAVGFWLLFMAVFMGVTVYAAYATFRMIDIAVGPF